MTCCDNHMVKVLCVCVIFGQVADRYIEPGIGLFDPADRRFKPDPIAHTCFFNAPLNVVEKDGSGRIRCDLLSEMLFKAVVSEFQPFLGAIRPQVPVHGAMDRLPVLIQTCPPRVVPKSAPVGLFLEADDFRNFGAFGLC